MTKGKKARVSGHLAGLIKEPRK